MFGYTYDAFNRLVKAEKAYRDAGGTVRVGSTLTTHTYDGRHRRVTRTVTNSGALDGAYNAQYAGDRLVEEYLSSVLALHRQHVWGLSYIDELIETRVLLEVIAEDDVVYARHYALLDGKYCVMGLVDSSGAWVQRYEYTPDGRRQVYISAGTNDPEALTPTSEAPRWVAVPGTIPYALCDIGFQGLMHDEVTGNVYQRAREYSPRLGRFLQRDPLGYPDGLNTYAAYHVLYGGVDPSGMALPAVAPAGAAAIGLKLAAAAAGLSVADCLLTPSCREDAARRAKEMMDDLTNGLKDLYRRTTGGTRCLRRLDKREPYRLPDSLRDDLRKTADKVKDQLRDQMKAETRITDEAVRPGDEGLYGDLLKQKKKCGETEPMDMDHRPSYAAQKKALENKLGRKLTDKEAKALQMNTPAVATPRKDHQQKSRTYGGRNNQEKIDEDVKDLDKARKKDDEAMGDK